MAALLFCLSSTATGGWAVVVHEVEGFFLIAEAGLGLLSDSD